MKPDIEVKLSGLPVQPLLDAIDDKWWSDITMRQKYPGSAHHDTECIFLRGPRSFLDFFDVTAQDYPRLDPLLQFLMPVMKPVLDVLECPPSGIGRVLLVRLMPRSTVKSHTDTGPYADAFERHHVVLSTNPGCAYYCGEDRLQPSPGDCFWFDHHKPHSATNLGHAHRVHLIVDTLDRRSPTTDWSALCPRH